MVTISQVREGVALYVEKELVSKLNGLVKWGFAFASNQIISSLDISKYLEYGKQMGYVTQDSMVDIDRLCTDFMRIAREQGSVVQHFAVIGDVTFTERDIDLLRSYILRR